MPLIPTEFSTVALWNADMQTRDPLSAPEQGEVEDHEISTGDIFDTGVVDGGNQITIKAVDTVSRMRDVIAIGTDPIRWPGAVGARFTAPNEFVPGLDLRHDGQVPIIVEDIMARMEIGAPGSSFAGAINVEYPSVVRRSLIYRKNTLGAAAIFQNGGVGSATLNEFQNLIIISETTGGPAIQSNGLQANVKGCILMVPSDITSTVDAVTNSFVPFQFDNTAVFGFPTLNARGNTDLIAGNHNITDIAAPPTFFDGPQSINGTVVTDWPNTEVTNALAATLDLTPPAGANLEDAGAFDADLNPDAFGQTRGNPPEMGPTEISAAPPAGFEPQWQTQKSSRQVR